MKQTVDEFVEKAVDEFMEKAKEIFENKVKPLNQNKMKTAELGQFLLWQKRPAKIIGKAYEEQAIIEIIEKKCCPHCGGDLGKEQIHVVVSSPMYQKGAEPIETIKQI